MIATVRVMPQSEEDEDRAMEFEYKDYEELIDYLMIKKTIKKWKYEGNAFSIESVDKESITDFQKFLKSKYPDEQIGIEWDYCIED